MFNPVIEAVVELLARQSSDQLTTGPSTKRDTMLVFASLDVRYVEAGLLLPWLLIQAFYFLKTEGGLIYNHMPEYQI